MRQGRSIIPRRRGFAGEWIGDRFGRCWRGFAVAVGASNNRRRETGRQRLARADIGGDLLECQPNRVVV